MFYMILKLQRRIFSNGSSISLDMSNKIRQRSMLWTLSISVPDHGLDIIVRKFYLCNSEKANAVILEKKGMTLHADVFLLQSIPGGNRQ